VLKYKIETKINKKKTQKITWITKANPFVLSSWFESWDDDNLIESRLKWITELNCQLTKCWRMKLKKISVKKMRKKTRINQVNLLNPVKVYKYKITS